MKEDLEKELAKKYPTLIADCYVGVGDGWYDIIDNLCSVIVSHEKNLKRANEIHKKYNEPEVEYYECKAVQIKEKYGGLRFYVYGGDEYCHAAIITSENLSHKICEVCGNRGTLREDGWWRTLCDTHEEERRWRKQNESKTVLPDSGQMG